MASSQEVPALASRVLLASFAGPVAPEWLLARVADGLGGVCLYGDNVRDAAQVAEVTAQLHHVRPAALTALDEEGGDVTRLHYREGSPHAGHLVLGRVDDEALTRRVAGDIGTELTAHGVDLDLGPVADVGSDPRNPVIGVRSFGADAGLCARHVAAWVEGLQAAGAGACLKHFPGHGDTATDSHLDLPVVDQPMSVLRERELVPFAAGVRAGAVAVMTSHVVLPAVEPDVPATFSRHATDLLRRDLAFTGLLVSDALDMRGASAGRGVPAAAVLALRAGTDLLCLGPRLTEQDLEDVVAALVTAVDDGTVSRDRLAEAAQRVDAASSRLAALREHAVPAPARGAGREAARRAMRVTGVLPALRDAQVVRLDAGSNQAVGHAPWGLPAEGRVLRGSAPVDVREGDTDRWLRALDDRPVVLLVKDAARHAWVRDAVELVLRARPDAVLVEMGWPSPWEGTSPAATVHTFGASAASGAALDDVLAVGS